MLQRIKFEQEMKEETEEMKDTFHRYTWPIQVSDKQFACLQAADESSYLPLDRVINQGTWHKSE
jgi:hypothetical protein